MLRQITVWPGYSLGISSLSEMRSIVFRNSIFPGIVNWTYHITRRSPG
jgi:hypothetical protein